MGAIEHYLSKLMPGGNLPARQAGNGARLSQRRLQRAVEFMRAHIADDIRLEDIAAAANLSVFHFARAFRNTTGVPPYRYFLECRVERVRELLPDDDGTLAEIAVQAGFADQSHMCNVFKRLTGLTPRQCREHMRKALQTPASV